MKEPTFGDLLREHLQKQGIVYEKLGKKLGVNKSTISRWVSNQQKPDFEQLRRIPRALGLSQGETEELLKADGRKYSYKDLWITTPEDNTETKSEVSGQKTEEIGGLPKDTESKSGTFVIQLTESELVDQNNRRVLLQAVKRIWVDNYLEHCLHSEAALQLKLRDHSHLVDNLSWKIIPKQGEKDEPLYLNTQIIDAFDEMEQRLLILGEPGAGKTIMLLELTRALLERAEKIPAHPIPVVFLLGSWSQKKAPLAKWMVDELSKFYRIPKKYGQKWIDEDKLLPLLDGLDEVKSEDQNACVEAINQFRKEHLVPLAICSRIADYEKLTKRLDLQGAIFLESLTNHQINSYLNKAGSSLSALRDVLVYDKELQELSESPLTLDIMSMAYQDATTDELLQIDTGQTRRQSLFNSYIRRMFGRRETDEIYSSNQTIRWLRWLANRLMTFHQPIFMIERMQPEWLRPIGKNISFLSGFMLLAMPLLGIILGLVSGELQMLTSKEVADPLIVFPLVGLIVGLIIALIDGVSGKFRNINPIEQPNELFRSLKSYIYAFLLWGISGILSGWFGSKLLNTLVGHWTTTSPVELLTLLVIQSHLQDDPIGLQKYGIDSRLAFWMDVITYHVQNAEQFVVNASSMNADLNSFIWSGICGKFGGGATDIFWGGLLHLLIRPLSSNHQLSDFLVYGVMLGLVGGVVGAFMGLEPAREFRWRWHRIKQSIYSWGMVALGMGLLTGLSLGLNFGIDQCQKNNIMFVIATLTLLCVVIWGLGGGILGMIVCGFVFQSNRKANELSPEETQVPNQGIWLSIRYSLVSGFSAVVFLGFLAWYLGDKTPLSSGLFWGLPFALIPALIGREDAVIKHFLLRTILWLKGHVPWNYARFLNYATGLIFTRKIGGGYIFIHRAIMEHFASMDEQTVNRVSDNDNDPKQP